VGYFTAVDFWFNVDFDHPGQDINVAIGDHFLVRIEFRAANCENIGITTIENTFLDNGSFSSAAGPEPYSFSDKGLHASPAGIEIRFDNHLDNTSGV
jgi:hypothetical protein